jgi:Flp pilus assembly protein TadD
MRFLKPCFALACLALWSQPSFAGDPQWVEIRSPNFSVITDAGGKRGRDVALHFEQMRSVFGTLMTKAHLNLPAPLQIVAFRNSKEMRAMSPVFNGKPTEDAGLFQPGDDRSFIMLDMSTENPWSIVFHEYAHQLMNGNVSERTQPWFEEGFAEYFSSIEVDRKEARVGRIPEDTYRILQQNGMMPVADLFRVRQYSKTYNESGDHRNTFYAESSLVVHYLYDNKLVPKLVEYFDAVLNQKKSVEQAMQQALGMTPEQFDKALNDYLISGRYGYYHVATPSGIVEAQFTETPVSAADARAVLADIHAHSPDHHDRALGEFGDVLKTDPNNALALRGMGYAYLQQRDFEHARQYFQRAAERDSKDPRVHYYNALLMNRTGGPVDEEKSEAIRKELETAIALDPNLADAYSLLAFAQTFAGDAEEGLATMRKALELAPRNETYQINLANLYMVNRKVDAAILLLRPLATSADPQVADRAKATLAQAEDFKESSSQPTQIRASENIERIDGSATLHEARIAAGLGAEALPPSTPVRFIKGRLAAVDCSADRQALLNVISGGQSLKLHVGDRKHVVLIGADEFSCDWKNKNVSLNYRGRQDGDGDVVSLEIR